MVKYFKRRKDSNYSSINSKFIYDDDYNMLKTFLDESDIKVRTLDVQIVDLADEIAYAAHDLEDCLRAKAFTMDEILHEYRKEYHKDSKYQESYIILKQLTDEARKNAGYCTGKSNSAEFNRLFEQEISSLIINTLINDIDFVDIEDIDDNFKIKTGTQNTRELGFKNYAKLADGLKNIIFKCVNQTNDVYYYEQRGKRLLHYLSELYKEHISLLPPEYRAKERIEQYDLKDCDDKLLQKRLICDYISGMMDGYAISTYEKYSGKSFDNILWTIRSAVNRGNDLNLPRLVGKTADEAKIFADELYKKIGNNGIVAFYPYFVAHKSGTLSISYDNIIVEAVNKDLWNLVTNQDLDVSLSYSYDGILLSYHGNKDFFEQDEIQQLLVNAKKAKSLFRDTLIEGGSALLEWSFASSCDITGKAVGEQYLVFYEARTI